MNRRRRRFALAAAFVSVFCIASPALAHHYRDSLDTSTYWRVLVKDDGIKTATSGGKVLTTAVRQLKANEAWSYVTTSYPWDGAQWRYDRSNWYGEVQAWITCSGKSTAIDAYYSTYGRQMHINQNGYCNAWVSLDQGGYMDYELYGDDFTNGYINRKYSWDGTRVFW